MVMGMACGTHWGLATRGWMRVGDVLPEGRGKKGFGLVRRKEGRQLILTSTLYRMCLFGSRGITNVSFVQRWIEERQIN